MCDKAALVGFVYQKLAILKCLLQDNARGLT